jgi:threonine 3-dehydrogenase
MGAKASAEGAVALRRASFSLDAVSKTMPALVKRERAPGLGLEEVPLPEIGPNDVLIRVQKGSICGTDVHIYNWDAWAQKTIPSRW